MGKILVAHADGLFVENPDAVPSADPIMDAILFAIQVYSDGTNGAFMLTTARQDNPTVFGPWLAQLGLKPGWIYGVPHEPVARVERTLSLVGRVGGRISYYLTADNGSSLIMAGHGIPAVHFRTPAAVLEYRPKAGGRWSEVYEHVEEEVDDDDEEPGDDLL